MRLEMIKKDFQAKSYLFKKKTICPSTKVFLYFYD